ncbi:2,5-diamino-6-(ribosylamino)-4(3H)-pyrimidinone 5'-phosphate reductase [Candidatus Bathyarchaeota archaeon]|nr:MAG: 2,5-diamino-6-(ribosylamino)-4(3H)-pyrimidinone 5'-phosphate reductase [Candidatus Bathyarchaeota archaeon]
MAGRDNRPYVILNAAMTLDGKIATWKGDSEISSTEDWERVHKLRAWVDGLMIGIGTLLKDNPKLTVKYPRKKPLTKIVVDSLARTPTNAKIFQYKDGSRIVLAVTSKASKKKIKKLQESGATVIVAGSGRKVNLKQLLQKLWKMGIKILMVEGGGNLNWGMVKAGLVDEVRVAVAPILVGGKNATTLVEGEGYPKIQDGLKLKLVKIETAGENLVLTYKRKG